MSIEFIALLATIGGIIIGVAGKFFTAKISSTSDEKKDFRQSLLKRIAQLETRQAAADKRQMDLEKNIQTWTMRYWALYRWMVRFCVKNNLDIMPPTFHEMETEEIRQNVAEMYQKKSNFSQKHA